jgi:signal peptidase I
MNMTPSCATRRATLRPLAGFGIVVTLFSYSLRLVRVQGRSMEPSFYPGQWLLVRRANWPAFPLSRGDVVVFALENDLLIKRVAALPGERPPEGGLPLRRFRPPRESRGESGYARLVADSFAPVPDGHLYLLGDNADVSEDSRSFGPIDESAVIGRVIQWEAPQPPQRKPIGDVARGRQP